MENTVQSTQFQRKPLRFTPPHFKLLVISWLMILSGFVQAQNVNANLISNSPLSCNLNGYIEFQIVPLSSNYTLSNVIITELNGVNNFGYINFPYADYDYGDENFGLFNIQNRGMIKYTFKGTMTVYTSGGTSINLPFESSIDYSNIAVNFNVPIAYFSNSTTATTTISLVNPYAGFSFKWYGTNANGLVNYSDVLASGMTYTSTYGNGRRYFVEGVNPQGCTISKYISKTLVPQTTGLSGTYELTQDCNATETENSNPNIIKPQLSSNSNFSNFEWRWYDKSSWTAINSNADPAFPYTQFSQDGYVINRENQNLDLATIPDSKEFVCVIFSNGLVYQIIQFQVYGNSQTYTGLTFNWNNTNIIFKQAVNLSGDPYDGLIKNKSLWEKANANFDKCTLNVDNTKILVLTERNSFNRLFLKNNSALVMTGSSKITSTCYTWGGIYVIDRSQVSITGSTANNVTTRPVVSNANVGVCLMRDLKPDAEDGDRSEKKFSLKFPFFEDSDSDLDESNVITIDKALFMNNYYHTYFLSPIKIGNINNTVFDCKPERMLFPYEPKIIDGKENLTITEACIVGYNSIYPHTDFLNSEYLTNAAVAIGGNSFNNAVYGVFMPIKSMVNTNYYNNILYSGIRYFSLFIDDPNTGGTPIGSGLGWFLQNQNFYYNFPKDYHLKFKYQLNNLKSYWNDINGFQEVNSDFLNSGNIAKFGLSTDYAKLDGEPIKHPLAIFSNSSSEMEIPESQEITYQDQSVLASSLRNSLDIRFNLISNESSYYLPIHGILMGQIDGLQVNENTFKRLDLGISLSIPIKKMERNRFVNNKIGIQITPQRIFDNPLTTTPEYIQGFLQFNCNHFETENTTQAVGLKVENGVQTIDIGGTNSAGFNERGANLWPTANGIDRSETPVDEEENEIDVNDGWQSPSNWTSIVNENSNANNFIRYSRFKNEFVGTVNSTALVRINASVSGIKAYTSANNFTPPPGSNDYLRVCDNTQIVNTVYFPVPLIGSDRGPIKTEEPKTIEVSVQSEIVDIRSKGNTFISKVQVVDLLGRTIVKYSEINSEHFKLPLNQLQKGTYVIQILDSENKPFTSKLQR